jgi:hypothetical protein
MEQFSKFPGLGRAVLALLVVGTAASLARGAVAIGNSDVQIGGFFSQGYLYNTENNYPTEDKGGTFDFREMAFNASTTVGAHLRVGAQAFAQSFGNIGDDKVILDWAVADYNFSPAFGIRLGRVKYPKGLYGEALDLDVVRPFIFLPYAVYNPVLRDFASAVNGASIYGTVNAGKDSSFDYKLFYGKIPMSPSQGVAEFYNNFGAYSNPAGGVSQLKMDYAAGGQVVWNAPVNGLKFVYSYSWFSNLESNGPFIAYPAANLNSTIPTFSWNTISSEYAAGNWTFAAEWQRTSGTITYGAPPFMPNVVSPVGWDGWYVSAARRFNEKFELGAYYGDLKTRYPSSTDTSGDKHQGDLAVSAHYDFSEHVSFKVEVHWIDGHYEMFNTPRIVNPTLSDSSTVVAVKTTFSF